MIKSELLKDKGVLIVSPVGPLAASDFEHLAGEIDPYIEQNGRLHGLMIHAESFPGWKDFAALLSHLRFVRDYQSKIEKVAAVSDSSFLAIMPSVVGHFVKAQVKHFNYDDKDKALEWLAARDAAVQVTVAVLLLLFLLRLARHQEGVLVNGNVELGR